MMEKTLEGIRVIDFTGFAAGPSCAKFLREWGAEDIILEPVGGSTMRTAAPHLVDFYGGYGKKSIALDLKTPEGKEAAYRLIKTADVFIHNYRTKAINKLGLDYETLSALNPRLIWAQLNGYGDQGPDKDLPGYDTVSFWARGGMLGDIAEKGTVCVPPISVGDVATGQGLAGAVCAALYHREKTGKGMKLYTSLLAEAMYLHHNAIIESQYGSIDFPQSRKEPWRATLNTYQCKDGKWVSIGCGGSPAKHAVEFPKMMRALDREDIAVDPRFIPYEGTMYENAPVLVKILEDTFAQFDRDEAVRRVRGVDVAIERVQTGLDLVTDPQAVDNQYITQVTASDGKQIGIPNAPIKFGDDTPAEYTPIAPMGVYTSELLKEVGYSDSEIQAMADKKITVLA